MAEEQRQRLIFMGTPFFAAKVLQKLLDSRKFDILAVFCGPDRRKGRGMKTEFCDVKKMALAHDIPVWQPSTLKDGEVAVKMRELAPDFLVVAAYGFLIPPEILEIPKKASINVHASLLPAYRGAAPIQRAIIENFQENAQTGVSIMQMEKGLDAGPVYAQKALSIGRHDRRTLEKELALAGGELLVDTLEAISREQIAPVAQDESMVTWAPKLEKTDGVIDWRKGVAEVDALVRGVTPWPGAQTNFLLLGREGEMAVTILPGEIGDSDNTLNPGEIVRDRTGLRIACADGWYLPGAIRPQGHREISPADFANGYCRVKSGLCGIARR